MVDVRVQLDISDQVKALNELASRQVPFATSLAVNLIAKAARQAETDRIFHEFTVRRPARLRTSVAITRVATKRSPEAELTVRDTFLVQHEAGGVRRRGDVYGSVAQPIAPTVKRIGILRGRTSPAGVLRSQRTFVGHLPSGKLAVFRRKGKGHLELVFAFERQVTLKPRLHFEDTVNKVAALEWPSTFAQAAARALK